VISATTKRTAKRFESNILFYLFVVVLSLSTYLAGRVVLSPGSSILEYRSCYKIHALLVFGSFLILPLFLLFLREGRGVFSGIVGNRSGILLGLCAYGVFTPIFVFLFGASVGPVGDGWRYVYSAMLVSINVSSVDFFTKRVVQYVIDKELGVKFGVVAGFLAWVIGHIPEHLWLSSYGTPITSALFLAGTGIVLSIIYAKTKDVVGFMMGHAGMNVFISLLRMVSS
jgi:hypothetical protein